MKKELPGGWKEFALKDIGNFLRGSGISKKDLSDTGIPAIRYGDIYTKYDFVIKNVSSFTNSKGTELKKGDILFAGSGETAEEIGKSVAFIDDYKAFAGGDIIIFRPNIDLNSLFLSYILNSGKCRKDISIMGQGHTVVHIYASSLEILKVILPPLDEQKRIADILSTFDDLIENLTKLIEKKEIYKKGVMQRVLTGKVRFEGFTDEWKTMRIGDICEYKNGNSFENYIDENGKLFLITLDSITIDGRLKNNHKKINIDTKELLSKNDIVMILSDIAHGYFLGLTAVIDKDNCYVLNQRVALLKPNNIIVNSYFLSKLININQKYFKKYGQGSSQQNLQKKSVENFIVKIPSLEEQNKIAELLTLIDKDIEILKRLLHLRKLQKKGVMQKLLTGEVRV